MAFIYIVNQGNAELKSVQKGISDDGFVELIGFTSHKDADIVFKGQNYLSNGVKIRVGGNG